MGLSPPAEHRTVSYVPESQEGWVATRLDFLVNWSRANSLWPMPFGTACCAIEFIAASMGRHDFIRLGVIPFAHGPRQAVRRHAIRRRRPLP